MTKIRTRFAPSPTGYLHIGGVRTALFSWLYARHHGGEFILRIEDTDRERSTQASVDAILQGMAWLGLDADEGPFYQTQRFDRYKEVIQQLLDQGDAYYCRCSKERLTNLREEQMAAKQKPRYDGCCRDAGLKPEAGDQYVIRFRNPDSGSVVIDDQVKGKIEISNGELDDLIIARGDGTPTYNLTVVVDDWDMGINHVIRGDDHINNTPRQINILKALGAEIPVYAHVPMILGADGQRLSKRHGAVSVLQYRDAGYLPHALLNYLLRLGWSHGDKEIFSLEEMIDEFSLAGANKAAATFDPDKLDWLNQHYIKATTPAELLPVFESHCQALGIDLSQGPSPTEVIALQQERAKNLKDLAEISHYFYQDFDGFDANAAKKNLRPVALPPFKALHSALEALDDWNAEVIHTAIEAVLAEFELKLGKIAQPLRVAVTGAGASPSIDATVALIGKERCLHRMQKAIDFMQARAEA